VREQNEMLGYHREAAPNPEKELARIKRNELELAELRRISRIRTDELARGNLNDN